MIGAEVLGRLLAMRDVLDGLIAELDVASATPACAHPEAQRQYVGEMGNIHGYDCRACGTQVAADAAIEQGSD